MDRLSKTLSTPDVQACKWPCRTTSAYMYTEWMAPFKPMWLNVLFLCFSVHFSSHFPINVIIKCDIFP